MNLICVPHHQCTISSQLCIRKLIIEISMYNTKGSSNLKACYSEYRSVDGIVLSVTMNRYLYSHVNLT